MNTCDAIQINKLSCTNSIRMPRHQFPICVLKVIEFAYSRNFLLLSGLVNGWQDCHPDATNSSVRKQCLLRLFRSCDIMPLVNVNTDVRFTRCYHPIGRPLATLGSLKSKRATLTLVDFSIKEHARTVLAHL